MSAARWTDDDLLAMWQAGYRHALHCLTEAADDIHATPLVAPPTTHQQRIAQRRAALDAYAAASGHPDHPGGPVPCWGPA